jgi:hypothetical protein
VRVRDACGVEHEVLLSRAWIGFTIEVDNAVEAAGAGRVGRLFRISLAMWANGPPSRSVFGYLGKLLGATEKIVVHLLKIGVEFFLGIKLYVSHLDPVESGKFPRPQ